MTDVALVFVTTGSNAEAETLARTLLAENLIACANLLPGVRSIYRWKGEVEEAEEVLMLLKTRAALVENLIERVRNLHSYEVCEILVVPVQDGNAPYLDWVRQETTLSQSS